MGAALASLLLTLLFQVIVPMARGAVGMSDQSHLESMALIVVNKLQADLQSSCAAGLSAASTPTRSQALAIHPVAGIDQQGRTVYEDHLIVWYWLASEGRVIWRKWPPAPPILSWTPTTTLPARVPSADFSSLMVDAPGARTLAAFVTDFQITGVSGGYVSPPVKVRLSLEKPSTRPSGKASIVLERAIYLPNTSSLTRQEKP